MACVAVSCGFSILAVHKIRGEYVLDTVLGPYIRRAHGVKRVCCSRITTPFFFRICRLGKISDRHFPFFLLEETVDVCNNEYPESILINRKFKMSQQITWDVIYSET